MKVDYSPLARLNVNKTAKTVLYDHRDKVVYMRNVKHIPRGLAGAHLGFFFFLNSVICAIIT